MKCSYCGNECNPSKYQERQYKAGKNIFCSTSCGTKYRYKDNYEEISEEDLVKKLEYMFYETELPYDTIKSTCGVSQGRFVEITKKYNIKRSSEKVKELKISHMQDTIKDKYGVTNVMELQECRDKIKESHGKRSEEDKELAVNKAKQTKLSIYGSETYNNRDKAEQTYIDKYGVKSPVQRLDIIEKRKQASFEKYGVDNPFNSKIVQDRANKTLIERYGKGKSFSDPTVRSKILKTMQSKYGVDNIMKSELYKKKQQITMFDKYGVVSGLMTEKAINSHKCGTISKINLMLKEELSKVYKEDIRLEKPINKFIYDICLDDETLIDLNPTVSHNTYISYPYRLGLAKENKPVPRDYHLNRTINAKEHGYRCIHIFDWDDWDKVKYLVQDKETLYARNLELREVDTDVCNEFLNEYHIQNTCRGQEVRLGLYRDNELIEIMTFGKPRYNKNYEYELLRLCTHKDYKVVGGAEKLFKHFIKTCNPNSIISYCDFSKFTGEVYSRLGFKQKGSIAVSKHWCRGSKHITDNLLRQRGYDQLFKANYGKGTSNEQLMLEHGWLPIYDAGQITFIWDNT